MTNFSQANSVNTIEELEHYMDINENRLIGIDVARALAIFGMVVVNFKIVMNAQFGSAQLIQFVQLFEGRAAALFVILAGVGITFLTNHARHSADPQLIKAARINLTKRAILLIIVGLAYTSIWPADILHFYGFYFLLAVWIFTRTDYTLLIFAGLITFLFPILMLVIDYHHRWNWETLSYLGFWTYDGMLRHILFNGFHPVVPWSAFLFFGMWLGRQNLLLDAVRKRLFLYSAGIWVFTELSFIGLRSILSEIGFIELSEQEVEFLFSTSIIPPMPQYVIAAASVSTAVLMICLWMSQKFADNKLIRAFHQTGRLALTLYVAHVIIGMGILESIGWLEQQSIEYCLLATLTFCVASILFSRFWLNHFSQGPLEILFKKFSQIALYKFR